MNKPLQALNRMEKGLIAETLAVDFLIKSGHSITVCNYRAGKAEIDIIAQINNTIIFVEVRMKQSNTYGYPEQSISEHKKALIREGAEAWMYINNWHGPIRFDIIAIEGTLKNKKITHFEDAF
jgi:putative endonuclease